MRVLNTLNHLIQLADVKRKIFLRIIQCFVLLPCYAIITTCIVYYSNAHYTSYLNNIIWMPIDTFIGGDRSGKSLKAYFHRWHTIYLHFIRLKVSNADCYQNRWTRILCCSFRVDWACLCVQSDTIKRIVTYTYS